MKKSHVSILAGLGAAGVLSGFAARRVAAGGSSGIGPEIHLSGQGRNANPDFPADSDPARRTQSALPEIVISRSTDTLASILTASPESEYSRIALWLTTASETDIGSYWASYKAGKRSDPVTDLVFLNWTRRNPRAAIAAVAGTEDDRCAWWSWAANDPEAALAAAKDGDSDLLSQVVSGIGEFNQVWLQAHLDSIPNELRQVAFERMRRWSAGQDPLATLDFMKKNGAEFDRKLFKSLAQKDPWAALDWMRKNPAPKEYTPLVRDSGILEELVTTLSRDRPEDLERMAAMAAPGVDKRAMEKAIFDRLLESDPAAALEQARKIEAPRVAAQRLGQIGLGLLATDREQAYEIAGEILKASPDKLDLRQSIEYPGGSSESPSSTNLATQLMNSLFASDREQTLDLMAMRTSGDTKTSATFNQYARKWAKDDLAGFTDWLGGQTDPIVMDRSRQVVGYQLSEQGDYLGSIEWLQSMSNVSDRNLTSTLYNWRQADPAAATEWLKNADIPEAEKARYNDFFRRADP